MRTLQKLIQTTCRTLTSSVRAFHAKASAWLAKGSDSGTIQEELSSSRLPESLKRNGLHFFSWKTFPDCYRIQQRWICENKDCRLLIEVADSDLLETVSDILAGITPESIRVTEPCKNEPSIEVRQINNDISRMLGAPQIDKDALRKKMMECISQKYKDLDEEAHTARKLQADFDRADTEDYKKTLNRTVSEIILYTDLTVGIILLNGQLIRKE